LRLAACGLRLAACGKIMVPFSVMSSFFTLFSGGWSESQWNNTTVLDNISTCREIQL
jgi:hypothetical protein